MKPRGTSKNIHSFNGGVFMTYRELLQIENYIYEIQQLKSLNCTGNDLKEKAEILDKKIKSSVKGYSPIGIVWNNAIVYMSDSLGGYQPIEYDRDKLCSLLEIMQATLQGILNSLPYYDEICDLDNDISYGGNISKNLKYKRDFIVEKTKKYSANIKFEQSVNDARDSILSGIELSDSQIDSIFFTTLSDIKSYRNSLFVEKRDLKEVINPSVLVKVEQTQNNSQVQNVATDLSISIQNCLKDLDDCETLSEQELEYIKEQLDEIKQLVADKRGKKKPIREKISAILKWVADKGTDAMIAILPTLITTLNLIK